MTDLRLAILAMVCLCSLAVGFNVQPAQQRPPIHVQPNDGGVFMSPLPTNTPAPPGGSVLPVVPGGGR